MTEELPVNPESIPFEPKPPFTKASFDVGLHLEGDPDMMPITTEQRRRSAVMQAMGIQDYIKTTDERGEGVEAPGAPVVDTAPYLSGEPVVGSTLSVTQGTWTHMDGDPPGTYAYAWIADGLPIADAKANEYALTSAEEGKTIVASVQATNSNGDAVSFSNPVGPVTA